MRDTRGLLAPVRSLSFPLLAGLPLTYFAVAAISTANFGTNTPIWFANALAVAALLRQETRLWVLSLPLIWFAGTLSVFYFGSGPAPLLALADIFEVLTVAGLIRRAGGAPSALSSVSGLARLILICLIPPIASSTCGAAALWWWEGAAFLPNQRQWYLASALGLLVVCPFLLIWTTPELRPQVTRPLAIRTSLLAVGFGALALLVFTQHSAAYLFVIFPALLLLVWSSGFIGATAGMAILLTVGLALTLRGEGAMIDLVLPATDIAARIQALQVYLAASALSSLPLAVVLVHQRDLTARLARAAEARGDFLAAMSHEIRTPMTGVLGIVDLLETEDLTRKQASYVESIRASGRHLLNIINDILDFSRIESGRIELEHIDFSLPATLERLLSLLNPLAAERGIELHFELPEHSPPVLKGDPTRLKQVLLNLTGNAIKFTAEGSVTINVSYRRLDEGLRFRFEIRDTGIGISPEAQADLFTAFTQADGSTKRQYGGTGLGLAISKRLVSAMGGEIGVSSVPGAGSVFWFELPFEEGDAIQLPRRGTAPEAPLAPRRVLVAEDVELNRDIIRTVLERDGHEVVLAWNGQEAVELVRERSFDLILMDVQMPIMNGVEATRRIREMAGPAADIPIIALTANVMAAEQEKCLEAGMNDVLMKPIEWERVRAVMRKYDVRSGSISEHGASIADTAAAAGEDLAAAPSAAKSSDDPVFVEATFHKLRQIVPVERLVKYAESLDGDVAALAAAPPGGDIPSLGSVAHKIVSQAGMLGLTRLSNRAARVEDACDHQEGLEEALRDFRVAARDVEECLWPLMESGR